MRGLIQLTSLANMFKWQDINPETAKRGICAVI